jgi:BirA family transcriptional regulator, biotin operon repressor / biotin---[acetyl-CoA-carboxylase] ligase
MYGKHFFEKTIYLDSVDSTNTYLKDGFDDRTVAYTFNQTAGRGRENRKWIGFKDKNLALSFLLKPQLKPQGPAINPVWFIAVSSLSLIRLLEKLKIRNSWIKWPNDVYVADRKISGILAESTWNDGGMEKIVVGLGLNINLDANDLSMIDRKATSVSHETGIHIDPEDLTKQLIRLIEKYLAVLLSPGGVGRIKRRWLKNCRIIGKNARWKPQDGYLTGIVKEILDDGTIVVKTGNGLHRIVSGDVEIGYQE